MSGTNRLRQTAKRVGRRSRAGAERNRSDGEEERGGRLRLGDAQARKMLDELHDKTLNFDLARRDQFTPDRGWKVDEYRQALPPEPPGDPVPGGSWEVARELMRNYEFADPAIVRAVYHADRPLESRDMLLEVRFYGLRFRFGVRVGGVRDELRTIGGRSVRVWGWNYRTLQGHLEMGQMDYEVWKWLDTGQVEFHTCRFSRHARVANPIVRLGLYLFGRRQQVKFALRACERMAQLTQAALGTNDRRGGVPSVADRIEVGRMGAPARSGAAQEPSPGR